MDKFIFFAVSVIWVFICPNSLNLTLKWVHNLSYRNFCFATVDWERLRAGERGNRGWDAWMASPTQWT